MRQKNLLRAIAAVLLCLLSAWDAYAGIQILSVHRGIVVNDQVVSDSSTGAFAAALLAEFDLGETYAEIESFVDETHFSLNGMAYETTEWGGELNDVESSIFFAVEFKLDAPFAYSLSGTLAGNTESEHYFLDLSLDGPNTNIEYDVWNRVEFLNRTGELSPGDYSLSLHAHPSVLGGLDGGSAEVFVSSVAITFSPVAIPNNVPEPLSLPLYAGGTALAWQVLGRRGIAGKRMLRRCA